MMGLGFCLVGSQQRFAMLAPDLDGVAEAVGDHRRFRVVARDQRIGGGGGAGPTWKNAGRLDAGFADRVQHADRAVVLCGEDLGSPTGGCRRPPRRTGP